MLTSEEQLKQIIKYDDLPQPPISLKPGFHFNILDYPLLQPFKKIRDSISLMKKDVVMQHIVLQNKEIYLFFYIIVSSSSCNDAREQTISAVATMSMMMMNAFTTSPADIGDFNIIPKHPTGKIVDLIHFVRNNIGVTLFLREGKFDVARLAKQIDQNIQSMKDYDQHTIKLLSPQINRVTLPDKEILLNDVFEIYIGLGQASDQDYLLYFFEYNDDNLNLEDEEGPRASFKALRPGENVINCVVVDNRNLLSTSKELIINIFEK